MHHDPTHICRRLSSVGAYYITTDLDLRARFEPSALDEALRHAGLFGGICQRDGYWQAGYSCAPCVDAPASALRHLLDIVESLDPEARDQWDRCFSRRFDMGFQSFEERFASRWQINDRLMRRLAAVNAELVVTIYRAEQSREAT